MFTIILFLWAACVIKNSGYDGGYFYMLEKNYNMCYYIPNKNVQKRTKNIKEANHGDTYEEWR